MSPRHWKWCRDSEKITQVAAPFHVLPRGFAGPSLLAMVLFEKYGQHQPLNRQSERYAREGIELSLSTLADQVGGCATLLRPLHDLIRAHVLADERVHGDETPVPVLAKGQTSTGRIWVYVRDDRPFGGRDPPAACSSTRAIAPASMPSVTCTAMAASCRPIAMPASTASTRPAASQVRSPRVAMPHFEKDCFQSAADRTDDAASFSGLHSIARFWLAP